MPESKEMLGRRKGRLGEVGVRGVRSEVRIREEKGQGSERGLWAWVWLAWRGWQCEQSWESGVQTGLARTTSLHN